MIRDALEIAKKDLLIEVRSKVLLNQLLPFVAVVLILFGFAVGTENRTLVDISPGIFWVIAFLSALLAIQRSFSIEAENQAKDGLLAYGLEPGGIFLGKVASIFFECVLVEFFLGLGVVFVYGMRLNSVALLIVSAAFATLGVASVGTLFGALAAATKVRETLLPLLVLPSTAPVLLAVTKAWEDGISSRIGIGDPWLGLLVVFALIYLAIGLVSFGSVLED